jgi:hypothetical protein
LVLVCFRIFTKDFWIHAGMATKSASVIFSRRAGP